MKIPSAVALMTLALAGCGNQPSVIRNPCTGCVAADGTCALGTSIESCGVNGAQCAVCASSQQCKAGACTGEAVIFDAGIPPLADGGLDDCSEEAKLVYVIDTNRTLSSFDPRKLGTNVDPFTELGRVTCPSEPGAEPFSMAVDRSATAWIIYDSGELFTVNVREAPLTCVKTGFMPQYDVARFGMGFAADAPGSTAETLFISGSSLTSGLSTTRFGTLSTTPPYALSLKGMLVGAPEMTGTGEGELWAFFPNVSSPKVAQLSKTDGSVTKIWSVSALSGSPRAWAFAFWGGDFYVFLERSSDLSTHVWKVNATTGALLSVLGNTTRHIVGAGVSTCAPVTIN